MKVTGLLHVAVLVSDLEAAKQFYEGILGLKQKPRPNLESPGVWYNLADAELHLIVTTGPLPSVNERPDKDSHFALSVGNYELIRKDLTGASIPFRESSSGAPRLFVRDPDGNLIELQKNIA